MVLIHLDIFNCVSALALGRRGIEPSVRRSSLRRGYKHSTQRAPSLPSTAAWQLLLHTSQIDSLSSSIRLSFNFIFEYPRQRSLYSVSTAEKRREPLIVLQIATLQNYL